MPSREERDKAKPNEALQRLKAMFKEVPHPDRVRVVIPRTRPLYPEEIEKSLDAKK